MKKVKISLCLLGYQRYMDKIEKLQNYSSKLFEVIECKEIKNLPNIMHGWYYSDGCIMQLLKSNNIDNPDSDLCLCFIDHPIEGNYFTRDLNSKTVLCSFHEVKEIFSKKNIYFFNYIHGIVLYEIVQIIALGRVEENYFIHDDTRNCLFDMCWRKEDIAINYSKPDLCSSCISKIESHAVEKDFIPLLRREFKTFRKPFFRRVIDFVKEKPILSIVITFISTIIINALSSYIYDWIK